MLGNHAYQHLIVRIRRRRDRRKTPPRLSRYRARIHALLGDRGNWYLAKVRLRCRDDSRQRRRACRAGADQQYRAVSRRLGHRRDHRATTRYTGGATWRDDEYTRVVLAHTAEYPVRTRSEGKDSGRLARTRRELHTAGETAA